MRKSNNIISVLSILIGLYFMGCTWDNYKNNVSEKLDTITFSRSIKGWELYSQPVGNDRRYSILIGTNRLKTYNEVVNNKIAVIGIDSLKLILDKFPVGEEIFLIGEVWLQQTWGSSFGDLCLPDTDTINEIEEYCIQKGLVLSICNQ